MATHPSLESTLGITPSCFCREREEREMAEREGRQILEEDCDEENIQSPFKPISNVISVVCVIVTFRTTTQHSLISDLGNKKRSLFLFCF